MRARIYVDSSVIGGCEDDEFADDSLLLMERFFRGDFVLVASALTVQELAEAPDEVRRHFACRRRTSRLSGSTSKQGNLQKPILLKE